jgi:hypothetical protein
MMSVGALSQSNGFTNSFRMDAFNGSPHMPPSPNARNSPVMPAQAFKQDPGQMQQKMARQRQLALERRRMAGRHAAVGMAQANQLPQPMVSVHAKVAGLLGEGLDASPGSFTGKAEAAFQDGRRPLMGGLKSMNSLKPVDEYNEQPRQSTPAYNSALPSERKMHFHKKDSIDEIEICDAIDSVLLDLPSYDSQNQEAAKKSLPGGIRSAANDASKGWSLHVEETVGPTQTGTVQRVQTLQPEQPSNEGRRWYKPSTWQKSVPKQSVAATTSGVGNSGSEVTQISTFGSERAGARTPDSRSDTPNGNGGWSGPGGRRKRPGASQPKQASMMNDMDFDFMDVQVCPGSIAEPTEASPSPQVTHSRPPRGGRERGESFKSTPAFKESKTEDVVEALMNDLNSEIGDTSLDNPMPRPIPVDTAPPRQTEDRQAQESQQPKQRRFRMPWSSSTNKQSASPEPTVETTMISDFNCE